MGKHVDRLAAELIGETPWRPCEAMTMRSQLFDVAASMIA